MVRMAVPLLALRSSGALIALRCISVHVRFGKPRSLGDFFGSPSHLGAKQIVLETAHDHVIQLPLAKFPDISRKAGGGAHKRSVCHAFSAEHDDCLIATGANVVNSGRNRLEPRAAYALHEIS